jgi:hypothetical protein
MPEVILCKDCKQSINKEVDQYVILERGTDRYPEVLAHVACEQKRATAGLGIEDWLRKLRWPNRSLAPAGTNGGVAMRIHVRDSDDDGGWKASCGRGRRG